MKPGPESFLRVEHVKPGRASAEREPQAGLDVFMMRHPWSETNRVMVARKKGGDNAPIPDLPPDPDVPLSDNGMLDRAALQEAVCDSIGCLFDGKQVSPYRRTRQGAEGMDRMGGGWIIEEGLRERDFGDLTYLPNAKGEFKQAEAENPDLVPPGGTQSLREFDEQVAGWLDRVKAHKRGRIFAMTHDNVMQRAAYLIENREVPMPKNGEMWQYTNRDPETGVVHEELGWKRRFTRPPDDPGAEFTVGEWEKFRS